MHIPAGLVMAGFALFLCGESMTNAFLYMRLVVLDPETRLRQDKSIQGVLFISGWRVDYLRVTGVTFRLIFWILLLKESGKKI